MGPGEIAIALAKARECGGVWKRRINKEKRSDKKTEKYLKDREVIKERGTIKEKALKNGK